MHRGEFWWMSAAKRKRSFIVFSALFAILFMMKNIVQVYIHKSDQYFVAECLDLPVVTQGKTLDELAQNLKEAISLQLED